MTYIIAEIGINHNGSLDLAKELIEKAAEAGADCVKFQKRTLPSCVPKDQRNLSKSTPWGEMTYLEYKRRLEFGPDEYTEIARFARDCHIAWSASVWDIKAADFIRGYEVPFLKIPSAKLTDLHLSNHLVQNSTGKIVLSTGMSTWKEVVTASSLIPWKRLTLLHCVSTYPSEPEEVNLRAMQTLRENFPGARIGYSGHERGTQITLAALAMGAEVVERHITLDRTMWGTDQAASLEPHAFAKMVRDIRIIEQAMGDGVKRLHPREIPIRKKLRGE